MTRVGFLEATLFFATSLIVGAAPVALAEPLSSFERGLGEMSHRDYEGAINSFSEAIGFNMNNGDAYFKRGQCYYYQRKYANASSDFDYLLKMRPRDAQAMLWAGTTYARQGNQQQAFDFYLKAMRNDPQLVSAFQQGNGQSTHSVNPRNEGAVDAYEKAVQAYIAERGLPVMAGGASAVTTDGGSLVTTRTEGGAVANGPKTDSTNIAPSSGDKDSMTNEPEMRVEQLDAAIQSDPSNAVLHFRRAQAYKRLGSADKALADYNEAINLDPMKSRFYLARARLYHEQNQPDLSQADIKKAQSVDPTVPRKIKFD